MNKILYVKNCNFDVKIIQSKIENDFYDTIVLLGQFEWDMPFLVQTNLVEYCREKNVEVHVVHGGFAHDFYYQRYKELRIPIENIHFWNSYFVHYTERHLDKHRYLNYNYDLNFKYPFICLNNRAHEHRCALIDELARTNLIKTGVVTWHNFLEENQHYQFKHFDRKNKLLIDDDFNIKLDSYLIPKQFHESFLHVVAESTISVPFLTEKTFIPMLYKKPFVLLALPKINESLKELGFVLYDEIIDYTYDRIENLQSRTEEFVKNIQKISQQKNLSDLYKKIQPKLEFNYNRIFEIIRDKTYVPKIIQHLYGTLL